MSKAIIRDVQGLSDTRALAERHLWMHFTPQPAGAVHPMFVRGDGCYVYDDEGRRHLDGLSGLFCVNVGHGRPEIAEAGARQAAELAYMSNWAVAHPRAAELAARIAELAPGDLNRVFFTGGGGEAIEAAIKVSRQYHKLSGAPLKTKIIARAGAYHGTSLGALSLTGITAMRTPFEPLMPGVFHVPDTSSYHMRPGSSPLDAAEAIAERIEFEGAETVAAVVLEPIQNSGGCIVPPPGYWKRVREICDHYGVLLVSDDVICSWGRIGTFFGAERFDYLPDLITTAKGLTSGYAPMGALIASDRVFAPFADRGAALQHGLTYGGHPVSAAVALANIALIEDEQLIAHVATYEPAFRGMLESLADIPIVGEVRGGGYFQAVELVADPATRRRFDPPGAARLTTILKARLAAAGLICRVINRGVVFLQLAPPLIAGPEQFAEIEQILRAALTDAALEMGAGR